MLLILRSSAMSCGSRCSETSGALPRLGCWCGGSGASPVTRGSDVSDGGTDGLAGRAVTLNFILVNGPDGWVIADVESPQDSLRMFLAQYGK